MSRTPRKSLRTATHALDQFLSVIEAHPDARQEVVERVGEEGVREIEAARSSLARLAARMERPNSSSTDTPD